jgi:phosphoenolpyruvate-protein phosphotransferase (PTS system enzyme I)
VNRIRDGIPASPGIVIAPVRVLRLDPPTVPHGRVVVADDVDEEVARFRAAIEAVKVQIQGVKERTHKVLGPVEAQIFEPQLLMLEDPEIIDGTIGYIRENHLTAERAFEWRVLEWEAQWSHSAHPMVLDRLNDLADVQSRVLRKLLGLPEEEFHLEEGHDRVVLITRDLTPSVAAQLDTSRIAGMATDAGTRTSHSSILARSLKIPAVVSLGTLSEEVETGDEIILDGRNGRVILHPTEDEKRSYRELDFQMREWEQEILLIAHLEPRTLDGVEIALRANIDLPSEADSARSHGADGIGLFRTEFLVVGRNSVPTEDEQFEAYRSVLTAFPDERVVIRTYDLGGDKFPAFLHMPQEENPFLGWRAIRVCLDEPTLFRPQLRALLRSGEFGDVRIMLPLVNEISEITRTRELIEDCLLELEREGKQPRRNYVLGAMIETPAAAIAAAELARHVDFFSIGTNDLVQYTLAVDRGNSRLASLYNAFHPAVVRLVNSVIQVGTAAGLEVSVCGEFASNPLGAFLMIGMGVDCLSVGPAALAEIKKVIRSVDQSRARAAVAEALVAPTARDVENIIVDHLRDQLELSRFAAPWNLSRAN